MKSCNAFIREEGNIDEYFLTDNGTFPNSELPVLHYKQVIRLPFLFAGIKAKKILQQNGWTNNWRAGIYTYHHYHTNTHEAMIAIEGQTMLLLGGENGTILTIKKGDAIVIPAGVAHKNLGRESGVICVGGYPDGINYDMYYGKPGERPQADENIAKVPVPATGPVCGAEDLLPEIWGTTKGRLSRAHRPVLKVI